MTELISEKTLQVLFSEDQIQKRVKEIAEKINRDFANCDNVVVVGVLCGSLLFLSDLVRYLNIPVQLEFIRVSSYGNEQISSMKVKPVDLTLPSLEGKNVILVEDIVDTGLTATFILDYIKLQHKALKVKFASMLNKSCARIKDVNIDYVGFEVDDKFVIGYGLDFKGYYRNLPYIGYLE